MSQKKAKQFYLARDFLNCFLEHFDSLLVKESAGLEKLEEARRELEAAMNALSAAFDGLPKFQREKSSPFFEERSCLLGRANNHWCDLSGVMDERCLAGLHANVKESLNQLLGQLSLEKPPPAAQLEAVEDTLESARLVMQDAEDVASEIDPCDRFMYRDYYAIDAFEDHDATRSIFDKMEREILAKVNMLRRAEIQRFQREQQAEAECLQCGGQAEIQ